MRRVFNYAPANDTVFTRVFYSNVGGFSNPSFTAYYIDTRTTGEYAEIYTLELAPASATVEPGNTYTFTATVTKQGGGAPSQAVPISVTVGVDPNSGGHVHGETYATRDKGSVSPASGNTSLQTTFTSTEVSGTHTITATCDLCANKTATATATVKVPGLEPIPDSPFYAFIGGEADKPHHDNHYLVPEAASALWSMAASYHFERKFKINGMAPPLLHLNDASLIWGGRFDTRGNWGSPHGKHRRGTVIDVRANSASGAIPLTSFDNFIDMATAYKNNLNKEGAEAQIHCTTSDGKNRQPPDCTGSDGSQDSNRHFHILLLGVNQ